MTKKEYILKLLSELKDDFPVADALYNIVHTGDISDELLNNIFETFKSSVKEINDDSKKAKMRKAMEKVKERMEEERKDKLKDDLEIQNLEKELEDLF